MVGSMRSGDSPSASGNNGGLGGPNSNNSGNSSSSSKGSSPSSGGNNGGLGGPTSNNSGSSKSSSSKGSSSSPSSSGSNGGLGGPTSNNSGNKGSSGSSSNANGGGNSGGQVGGGLNSGGNRASGAGPGASSNTSTTGGGFGSANSSIGGMNSPRGMNSSIGGTSTNNASPTFGGQNSPAGLNNSTLSGGMAGGMTDAARRADMAQAARAAENSSMSTYSAARSLSEANAQRADLAQQARATETQSMADMATWGNEVKSVVAAGPGWTTVALNNGKTETRKGDRASRNNNPGNIEAGDFATKAGAVGTDGRFAVFSSKEDGIKAIGSLLGTSRYTSKTVEGAISSYAPSSENNTASYASTVAGKIGVSKDTPMSSLTAAQRNAIAHAIMGVEGNTGYNVTATTGTDRFASTYMGGKTTSSAPKSAATSQQNDPSGLPSGTYPGHVVGDGIAPSFATPTKQATAAPVSGPTPAPAPAPAPTPAPARQPSLTEKVAAGAIDVGLGMLPGIGMGVSLVNGGLALTGNKTLGERIAGSIATGENAGSGPDSGADRTGGGNGGQVVKNTSTVPKEAESFESRYLAFVDPTPRPTPAQRWNYDTAGYS